MGGSKGRSLNGADGEQGSGTGRRVARFDCGVTAGGAGEKGGARRGHGGGSGSGGGRRDGDDNMML